MSPFSFEKNGPFPKNGKPKKAADSLTKSFWKARPEVMF
jgi:hypothetical protein